MQDPLIFLLIVLLALLAIPRGASQPVQPSVTVTPSAGTGTQSTNTLVVLILMIIILVLLFYL